MTFLNAILAFGTLAFTVPLVIHLLNRSRYRTIDWGAMIFLEEQKPSNSRKMEWKHLLLLAVRCLIPICLALAMAKPFLSGSSLLGIREPIATVIVLDDSLSMQSKSADGQTRWSIALRYIDELLKSLPEGSESFLILAGQAPKPIAGDKLNEQLVVWATGSRSTESGITGPSITGSIDLIDSTKQSLNWLADQSLTRRQIIYVSDFQSTDWSNEMGTLDELKRMASEQIIPPVLSWLNVSDATKSETKEPDEQGFSNCSVRELVVTPKWFSEGQIITASCAVHNHSRNPIESLAVSIQLDDKAIDSQKINIASSSSTRMTTRFAAPSRGWHLLTVKVDAVDDLEVDNVKQVPFIVQSRSRILLVDGELRSEPMQSQSDFLRIALSPFTFSQVAGVDYFDTRVIAIDKLADTPLDAVAAIALCNVPRMEPNLGTKLREFVERGGGVIAFLGNRVDRESWNRLTNVDQGGIRFFSLTSTTETKSSNTTDNQTAIDLESLEASLFKELSQVSRESIASVIVGRSTAISMLPDSKADRIAGFANGEPWIVRQNIGRGAIWVVTTSCDTVDTSMPTRPVFVPLMQRLFHAVSQSKPSIEVLKSGTPWAIRAAVESVAATTEKNREIQIVPPRLGEETITGLTWNETRQIGLYQATWEEDGSPQKSYCWMEPHSSSSLPHKESDRLDIAHEELRKLAEASGVKYFDSIDNLQASDGNAWQGREIGNWFWLAALACFIAEMAIAQSFSVPRRMPIRGNETEPTSYTAKGLG
jgi:hypothetical protein